MLMNSQTPVIDLNHLVRRYGRTDAVNGLSLRVQPGRCYGFFGRNGAGKTTTIKCLLNLLRPTAGAVKVFGLDPVVRREFIQTVIGAYQEGAPGQRTIFVSTHLITEFEGLIDEFTIIEGGREVLTLESDTARQRYQKIYARFPKEPVLLNLANMQVLRREGRELEMIANGNSAEVLAQLKA